jgi:hypothetical protein
MWVAIGVGVGPGAAVGVGVGVAGGRVGRGVAGRTTVTLSSAKFGSGGQVVDAWQARTK